MDDFDKIELTEEVKAKLREEQSRLIKIIEAFADLENQTAWQTIKEMVFTPGLQVIERQILSVTLSKEIDSNKLYRLQGEWANLKQFCDPDRLTGQLKIQLENIKNKLQ